jgi:gliding motility-associated-like protein
MASYSWIPSFANSTSIYVNQPGNYSLVTTSIHGCRDTASVTVTEDTNIPGAPFVKDTMICKGDSVLLHAQGGGIIHWAALPDYNSIFFTGTSYQTHSLFSPITYYLFSESGICRSDFDSVRVSIDDNCHHPVIPNIVTPNGDGLNDYFPFYAGMKSLDIRIYNRWGLLLYEGYQQLHGWDGRTTEGKLVSDGVYYYLMKVVFLDGYTGNYSGFVTVLTQ